MKLVMFDIDGTLTQTVGADESCFVQALDEVFGFKEVNTDWASYPHCSDSGVVDVLCQTRLGRSPSPEEIAAIQARFVALLNGAAAARPFEPVAGAEEMLRNLIDGKALAVSLASGGWECSARVKLASAGLDMKRTPAAFSDDAQARESIMCLSMNRAAQFHRIGSFESVVYVGDGVWDARAARNLGFPFIGISGEPGKAAKLHAEGACEVFGDYLDARAFKIALEKAWSSAPGRNWPESHKSC